MSLLQKYGVNSEVVGALAETMIATYQDNRVEDAAHAILQIVDYAKQWSWDGGYLDLRETVDKMRQLVIEADKQVRVVEGADAIDENQTLKDTERMMKNAINGTEQIARHPIALNNISRMTCGLAPGYYVIAGEPNMGKSAIIQNMMMAALDNRDSVSAYFSFDDSTETTLQRLVSRYTFSESLRHGYPMATAPTKIYNTGYPRDDQQAQSLLTEAWSKIASLQLASRLYVYDRKQIRTMDELEHQIQTLKKRHGKQLIVCVDAVLKVECKAERLRGIELEDYRADRMDGFSVLYDIPLLTTHELRKRHADDKDKPPTMEDTKGSGRFGYNAKFGALVYPVSREDWKSGKSAAVVLYVDKNKIMERTGKVYLTFDRAYNHIREASNDQ